VYGILVRILVYTRATYRKWQPIKRHRTDKLKAMEYTRES
jgi:hypothetical protein